MTVGGGLKRTPWQARGLKKTPCAVAWALIYAFFRDTHKVIRMKFFTITAFFIMTISTASAKSFHLYVGTYTEGKNTGKGIYRSTLDLETGQLSDAVLAAEADNPSFLQIHPSRRFLYSISESNGTGYVNSFAVNRKTGELKYLNHQQSNGINPCHLSISHTGKNLFVANYTSGSISDISIRANGKLAEPLCFFQYEGFSVNPNRQQSPHAHSINSSPDGRFIFAADLGTDKIMIYKSNPKTGSISPNNPPFVKLKPGAGPRHFTFHPSGKFAYVINELDSTITAFSYNSQSGNLTEIQIIKTIPEDYNGSNYPAEICVHPNGKFLYGSNRGHDSIAAYKINAGTGKLTFIEYEIADIKTPRNFCIDPTGTFCLVANQDSNSIVVFRINVKTGTLEPTGCKISIPKPACVRFL
ncbi:MAG: lactonase family protein [Phycisphaerae bacterium]|jgi:6-phosphogluconolactonase